MGTGQPLAVSRSAPDPPACQTLRSVAHMKISTALATALVASMLAACGTPAGRTGSGTDPVSLTAYQATPEELIGRLASAASDTAVTIEQVPHTPPTDGTEDTVTLADLAAGEVDLALLRAGRLTEEGADSLAPLGAPFVVTNDDQAIAIARDAVTDDLFASLPDIGLVGLGLVPVGLRHPFGYREPLLGAADYLGQTINVRIDAGVQEILEALGALARLQRRARAHRQGPRRRAARHRALAPDLRGRRPASRDDQQRDPLRALRRRGRAQARLGCAHHRQQDELTSSVAAARDEAYAAMGTEEALFGEWCLLAGAGSALASPQQLASLHEKLDPITSEVAAQHGPVIDRLRLLHEGTTDAGDLTCPVKAALPAWTTMKPRGDQGVLDGTWRFANEADELLAAGTQAERRLTATPACGRCRSTTASPTPPFPTVATATGRSPSPATAWSST